MFRQRITLPRSAHLGLLIAASVVILAWSFATGFRLANDEIILAWQVNGNRLANLFIAGFAQCAGLAALKTKFGLSQHIRLYLCLVLICSALIVASIVSMQIWLAALLVIAITVCSIYLSDKIELHTSLGRLTLGVTLYAVFFLNIVVYFAASTQGDDVFGGLVLWLFSNASAQSQSATWVMLPMSILIASLIVVKEKDLLAIVTIAVGVGLAGPLLFIPYFVLLVLPTGMDPRYKILTSGLLGGTFVVATSSIVQLMFGGYAPALIIPVVFVLIPLILFYSGVRIESTNRGFHGQESRNFERALLAIIVAISLAVVLHVNEFAQGLI